MDQTDAEFILYCRTHVQAPRAAFVPAQIARLFRLAGLEEPAKEWDNMPSRIVDGKRGLVSDLLERIGETVSKEGLSRKKYETHGLDTQEQCFFYEHEFYVLSNYSAFRVIWDGHSFDTSEAAYHWEKFPLRPDIRKLILTAPSAHVAQQVANVYRAERRPDWDNVKVDIMRQILLAKASQHEYVRRKLLETGDRELIENSWRDDFWGWGPGRDGQNWMGRLWMEVRVAIRRGVEL